jgi:2-keto-3-deoxy-L-rhamnonate aldolase RhmA
MVNFIRKRVLSGELMLGIGCVLGSSLTAEMAGKAGFDWLWLDMEHGSFDYMALLYQIQACSATAAAPVVRVRWNEPPLTKRALDLGAAGIVVPWVNTPEEAALAVRGVRYPPEGIRGVARANRATGFGTEFDQYFRAANEGLLTVVQIETEQAVESAERIAAVEGVDVLFVGPMDLSVSMGIPNRPEEPRFVRALERVVEACRRADKAPGIMLPREEALERYVGMGFSFVVAGSDSGFVVSGLKRLRERAAPLKPLLASSC